MDQSLSKELRGNLSRSGNLSRTGCSSHQRPHAVPGDRYRGNGPYSWGKWYLLRYPIWRQLRRKNKAPHLRGPPSSWPLCSPSTLRRSRKCSPHIIEGISFGVGTISTGLTRVNPPNGGSVGLGTRPAFPRVPARQHPSRSRTCVSRVALGRGKPDACLAEDLPGGLPDKEGTSWPGSTSPRRRCFPQEECGIEPVNPTGSWPSGTHERQVRRNPGLRYTMGDVRLEVTSGP